MIMFFCIRCKFERSLLVKYITNQSNHFYEKNLSSLNPAQQLDTG